MVKKYNNNNNIFIFVKYLLILILLILLILFSYLTLKKIEPFDFFTCTMTLNNVNPKFKDEYLKKFNNKHVSCGPCKNATLNLEVNTCPVDEYGSPSLKCNLEGFIKSSFGNPILFKYDISSENMSRFFCID
jgi:hypothetical protein